MSATATAQTCAADATVRNRTLLLVDDEENIIGALRRALRREGYTILSACSGADGLACLREHAVDVIVSDQRMPGMTGVEFLREVKTAYPETVRIVLSGYTELRSITDAINEGAIYKFLTKPWDDDQIRANIAEAFHHKELADENRRLAEALARSNAELGLANERLQQLLASKEQELVLDEAALNVAREVLHTIPVPILGIDEEGVIVFVNASAEQTLACNQPLLCSRYVDVLPDALAQVIATAGTATAQVVLARQRFQAICRDMNTTSQARGRLLILMPDAGVPPP
ncbi:MAG: response regulator [Rhodocyclaceae bacterium]